MTARQIYEYALVEINKIGAPSLLLEDYNYYIGKAIQQYINKVYNRYETNQQSVDDIRVLIAFSSPLSLTLSSSPKILGNNYKTTLPSDYLHILNCIVELTLMNDIGCHKTNEIIYYPARKLTSDMRGGLITNSYLKPIYKRPYYKIENINTSSLLPTNSTVDTAILNTSHTYTDGDRFSNISEINVEVTVGKDDTLYKPTNIIVEYIKSPMRIHLTEDEIDSETDTSQIVEFPDYVCLEIINEFVNLLLEHSQDNRLQTHIPITTSIATGVPQQK